MVKGEENNQDVNAFSSWNPPASIVPN